MATQTACPTLRDLPAALAFYSQFIRPGDLCFDIGAFVGVRTATFVELGARVIAVEPQAKCIEQLRQQFHDHPRVTIVPQGVAAEPGVLTLSVCEAAPTISTFSPKWKTGRFSRYEWPSTVDVPVTTLDALIEEHGVPVFCKIDVEGFEYSVLQGLSWPIATVSFEFAKEFLEDAERCMMYLASLGEAEFNYAYGEEALFRRPTWTDASTLLAHLHASDDETLCGDIYARFRCCRGDGVV
ncbi:MAG: FkbM family methyltransferase [Phycisphaerae bacterium]|nr:FkbM family methyltransferase [Phycisphaerae bacterium]